MSLDLNYYPGDLIIRVRRLIHLSLVVCNWQNIYSDKDNRVWSSITSVLQPRWTSPQKQLLHETFSNKVCSGICVDIHVYAVGLGVNKCISLLWEVSKYCFIYWITFRVLIEQVSQNILAVRGQVVEIDPGPTEAKKSL